LRTLFWIIALFALAAGLVVAAHYNTGYVLLVLSPYRVELSLNLLLILLFTGFIAGHLLLRLVSGTLRLPSRVREYRIARHHRKAQAALAEALQEFFAGRYARAERAAANSIRLVEHAGIGAIVAARAAHALRAYDRRDAYLAQIPGLTPEDATVKAVTEAELLLDHRRFHEALNLLKACRESTPPCCGWSSRRSNWRKTGTRCSRSSSSSKSAKCSTSGRRNRSGVTRCRRT